MNFISSHIILFIDEEAGPYRDEVTFSRPNVIRTEVDLK